MVDIEAGEGADNASENETDTGSGADTGAGAATSGATDTTRDVGEAALAGEEALADDWSPPREREDGTAVDGHGLPINHRLRALELARTGKEDPAGTVTADLIAAAGERIAAHEAHYPPLAGMKKPDLESTAEAEGVDISGAANNEERATLIAAARPPIV